jgi:hypothetical protein
MFIFAALYSNQYQLVHKRYINLIPLWVRRKIPATVTDGLDKYVTLPSVNKIVNTI